MTERDTFAVQVGEFAIGQDRDTGEPLVMFEGEWRPFREWVSEVVQEELDALN